MPVTTRLLQRLHEALGEDATNDLFAWWEEAATVNRAAVREVADLYFDRFDDRLQKGLAEVRAELRTEFRAEMSSLRSEMAALRVELKTDMAAQRADLIKWMFIFWAGTVIPLAGLIVGLSRL